MTPYEQFKKECAQEIAAQSANERLNRASGEWIGYANAGKYCYHFEWLGRPIIQYPQDIVAVQELIWRTRPDLIIETGIAHGGSLIMSASMLTMLDYCDAVKSGTPLDPKLSRRRVLGIDIDIRAHNRAAIEAHPMSHRIEMIQGSSIDPVIVGKVHANAKKFQRILVMLDSNHTHEHVLAELEAYAPLVTKGSYCVVFDTIVEDLPQYPDKLYPDRPWGKGNNPKTAVREFLQRLKGEGRTATDDDALRFEVDTAIDSKLLISVAPEGYLKRV